MRIRSTFQLRTDERSEIACDYSARLARNHLSGISRPKILDHETMSSRLPHNILQYLLGTILFQRYRPVRKRLQHFQSQRSGDSALMAR